MLAQVDARLMRILPGAAAFTPVAWPNVRDSLDGGEAVQPQDATASAYASLVLELMNNS